MFSIETGASVAPGITCLGSNASPSWTRPSRLPAMRCSVRVAATSTGAATAASAAFRDSSTVVRSRRIAANRNSSLVISRCSRASSSSACANAEYGPCVAACISRPSSFFSCSSALVAASSADCSCFSSVVTAAPGSSPHSASLASISSRLASAASQAEDDPGVVEGRW